MTLAFRIENVAPRSLLWAGPDGEHLRRPHPVSGWFARAVSNSKVPRTTPHDLRHTAASLAVSAGANVKAVHRMLGHASASMTLDIYADLFDDDLEAVATALHAARASVGKKWAESDVVARDVYEPAELPDADTAVELDIQKFQSSSSVLTALPITYDEPEPEKKSWFSSALGDNADRIAGFTSVSSRGNSAS
jgi:hypothetical protein